jgi:hypothetical protein
VLVAEHGQGLLPDVVAALRPPGRLPDRLHGREQQPIRRAMIAITTKSSTRVNAARQRPPAATPPRTPSFLIAMATCRTSFFAGRAPGNTASPTSPQPAKRLPRPGAPPPEGPGSPRTAQQGQRRRLGHRVNEQGIHFTQPDAVIRGGFHQNFSTFPFRRFHPRPHLDGTANASNDDTAGGYTELLPFLEQTNLHDEIWTAGQYAGETWPAGGWKPTYGPSKAADQASPYARVVATLVCPSDTAATSRSQTMWDLQYGKNSYGLCNGDAAVNGTGATLRGIFGQRRASPPTTPIQIAQIRDGLSNTIMTGEIASFSEHNRIQGSIKTNLTINNTTPPTNCLAFVAGDTYNPPTGDQGWRGGGWCLGAMAHSGFNTVLPPNGPSCNNWRTTDDGFYSAQSYHPGGVTVGLADGSVRFINETVDTGNLSLTHPGTGPSPYGVWGTLGSRAGGESLSLPD